jgi:glycosyltransferase involved in cell wall biosynthesis
MRICFYTTGDIKTLATMKRALGMTNPLVKLGWEVSIIALDTIENRKRIELEAESAKTYYFNTVKTFKEVLEKNKLLKIIKPDVVWICSLGVRNFILPTNKYKILVEHSELSSAIPDNRGLKKILIKFFELFSLFYDGSICASAYLYEYYKMKAKKYFRTIPIHYTPYAYNPIIINLPAVKYQALLGQYGSFKNFLYMGTITKNYGLFTMLEAVKILRDSYNNFKLFLLGNGRDKEKAINFINSNNLTDNVVITGYVEESDLISYFKLANAFISPLNDTIQDWARCPSKIYMYLPFNKPILTCAIGEAKEIFGEKGYYFDSIKPETLSTLMLKICQNNINKNAIEIDLHSWEQRSIDFNNWYKMNYI